MTHSTLTWFSGMHKPQHTEDRFLISLLHDSGKYLVWPDQYVYNEEDDCFYVADVVTSKFQRKQIAYWAYIPVEVELHTKHEAQSQIPQEK